jgi:phospholipid-translocating ATPase
MIFQQCSIAGIVYKGDGKMPEGTLPADTVHVEGPGSQGLTVKVSGSDNGTAIGDSSSSEHPLKDVAKDDTSVKGDDDGEVKVKLPKEVLAPFHSDDLDRALEDHDAEGFTQVAGFFTNLALCHTAMAAENDGVIEYTAQSPDESALVQAAADVGFVFKGKDRNVLRMRAPGSDVDDQYELLEVLEFTSARKRMSVILRKLDDEGKLFLLIKGADNVIFDRLAPGLDEIKQKTNADLEMFASEGLRTLCLAYRMISEEEYSTWARNYHDALTSLDDREGKIADVSAQLEHSLTLLGATAIEDKLQDGVPETIADLKRAGIKVWVATGDKLETAIAIGYSTNLLANDSNLIIVRGGAYGTPNSAYDQMRSAIEQFFGPEIVQDVNYHPPDLERPTSRRSLSGGRPSFQRNRSSNAQPKPLQRTVSGLSDLVGDDNGRRPGGYSLVIEGSALTHVRRCLR